MYDVRGREVGGAAKKALPLFVLSQLHQSSGSRCVLGVAPSPHDAQQGLVFETGVSGLYTPWPSLR